METPDEKADRLGQVWSRVLGGPVGLAACGCPNRVDGQPPALHICRACGYTGSRDHVHNQCVGCTVAGHASEAK